MRASERSGCTTVSSGTAWFPRTHSASSKPRDVSTTTLSPVRTAIPCGQKIDLAAVLNFTLITSVNLVSSLLNFRLHAPKRTAGQRYASCRHWRGGIAHRSPAGEAAARTASAAKASAPVPPASAPAGAARREKTRKRLRIQCAVHQRRSVMPIRRNRAQVIIRQRASPRLLRLLGRIAQQRAQREACRQGTGLAAARMNAARCASGSSTAH